MFQFQFQLYFHLLMYHIHHVLNHLHDALLCCIYYEFAVIHVEKLQFSLTEFQQQRALSNLNPNG